MLHLYKIHRWHNFLCPANKSNLVEKELYKKFDKYELKLKFKIMSTIKERNELEFLDVLHKITRSEKKKSF